MTESVLIVSGERGRDALSGLLREGGFQIGGCVSSGAAARRLFPEKNVDLLLINTPLPDEFGQELAVDAARQGNTGVLLIVRAERAEELSSRLEDYEIFVLEKPLSRQLFFRSVKLVCASRRRMLRLQNENVKLQSKIEEIRLVDRAKCALIQYLGMAEPEAHRYIEKQAMDCRVSRRDIAQGILKKYEN